MEPERWHRWWRADGTRQLRQILLAEWDPIGVRNVPEAQDEYDTYVGGVAGRLHDDADASAIAAYLSRAQDQMGMPRPASDLREVAERIVAWYAHAMRD